LIFYSFFTPWFSSAIPNFITFKKILNYFNEICEGDHYLFFFHTDKKLNLIENKKDKIINEKNKIIIEDNKIIKDENENNKIINENENNKNINENENNKIINENENNENNLEFSSYIKNFINDLLHFIKLYEYYKLDEEKNKVDKEKNKINKNTEKISKTKLFYEKIKNLFSCDTKFEDLNLKKFKISKILNHDFITKENNEKN
jgi:hypothetical protein